jgi:predicted glycoside hydrolase/deacetylase ChbG (UPF0249 family)
MKRLIINGDDFGYSEGIVRGVIDCHRAGVISSTSCMTNMPAWPQAAAYLVFNGGQPILPPERVPALVGADGSFLNDSQILRGFKRGTTAQLQAELRAQIERFIADAGRPPTHLDNHCSVSYIRPDRFRVTLDLAKEYGLPIRAPFGDDLEERVQELARINHMPPWLIRWQGVRYRRRVDRAGIRRPNNLIMDFSNPAARTVEDLFRILGGLRDGWISELLTHPGYDGGWREPETRALLDPRVRERLGSLEIELVNFKVL